MVHWVGFSPVPRVLPAFSSFFACHFWCCFSSSYLFPPSFFASSPSSPSPGYDLTDKSLVSLAEGCPGLKTVTFPFVSNLTDKAVVALAKGCPHIAEVNFKFCVNLTDAAVDALVEHCSELTSENVELSCCAKLSGDAMQKFPSNDQLFMDWNGWTLLSSLFHPASLEKEKKDSKAVSS